MTATSPTPIEGPPKSSGPPVLADTSGLYAILDADDRQHAVAARCWPPLLESGRAIVLHHFVLQELWSLLLARIGMQAVVVFQRDYLPLFMLWPVTDTLLARAISRCLGAGRRDLSLTDCVSLEIVSDQGIECAFAFDRHFRDTGLLLPGDPSWPR